MNKILIITGPTATGKTALALSLAKKFNGELLSVDSRQVYKRMDIGTGKDLPEKSKIQISKSKHEIELGYYEIDGIKLWGYDLVEPTEEFNVSKYSEIAHTILEDIWKRGKLPIVVGGTGFYIKALLDGIETMHIPNDPPLRNELSKKSTPELLEKLESLDPEKAASFNTSDRKNPVRLARAIEVAYWKRMHKEVQSMQSSQKLDALFIGLTLPRERLFERIADRVMERVERGVEAEIEALLIEDVTWDHQSMKALGYRQWAPYFEGEKTKHEVVLQWIQDEQKYAKRQMTWFQKDKRITWFDITDEKFSDKVEKAVESWHTK